MLYQLWDRAYGQLKAAVPDEDTRERNGETTSHNNELKGGGVVIKTELPCIHFIFNFSSQRNTSELLALSMKLPHLSQEASKSLKLASLFMEPMPNSCHLFPMLMAPS